jgi:putative sterol carrier protein
VAVFLSPAWIGELDLAARRNDALRALGSDDEPFVLGQEVIAADHDAAVGWTLVVDGDGARVEPQLRPDPQVVLRTDADTLAGIAQGTLSAQQAFVDGRIRLGGDVRVLIDRVAVLAGLGDVFAAVRADTTW